MKLRKEIEAGVFFSDKNELVVMNRKGKIVSFEMSPYRRHLNDCVIYLDDCHTRGTDLKIPKNTKGAVTLGKGVTKDRLMQACMRMRLLGDGHSVCFFSSYEVHNSILKLFSCKNGKSNNETLKTPDDVEILNEALGITDEKLEISKEIIEIPDENLIIPDENQESPFEILESSDEKSETGNKQIGSLEVLKWAMNNTREQTVDGFLYWSVQGLSFYRRQEGYQKFIKDKDLQFYFYANLDKDKTDLKILYEPDRIQDYITNIISKKIETNKAFYERLSIPLSENYSKILSKCLDYIKNEKKYSQLLEEEQEIELEIEQEEQREVYRPVRAEHDKNIIDKLVKVFVETGKFDNTQSSFISLPESLKHSSVYPKIQPNA